MINSTQNNVPTLRFPEFEGEWEEKKLGEVTQYTKGFAFKSDFYKSEGIRIIRVSDLGARSIKQDNEKIFVQSETANEFKKYLLNKGDIIITTVGSKPELLDSAVGRGIFVNKDNEGLLNQNMLKFNHNTVIENGFIFGYINSPKYVSHIKDIQRGNANQSNITVIDLLEFKIYIAPLPEQTKIANFLTAVDDKISQLKKKKELLEQYKKGVMQQIFSQKLRFKDENGEDFAEWKEVSLSEILIEKVEKSIESNQYRVLSSTAKGLFYQDEYFKREIASKDSTGYKILRKNQLVFSPQNLWLGNININTEFEIGIVSPSYKIFNFIETKTSVFYCKYFLLTPQMMFNYEQCSEQGASVVRRNLDINQFLNICIMLPSLSEQTKIANFLSAIDEKIGHCGQQIASMERWKKGLLQQLFV